MTILYCIDAFLIGGLLFANVAYQCGRRDERRTFRLPRAPQL